MSESSFDPQEASNAAEARIRQYIFETPLEYSPRLSHQLNSSVYLKCEHLQKTSSFKIRGALNKILTLSPTELSNGAVTASSGNFGAALAYSLQKLGARGIIFVPENASTAKTANIRGFHGELKFYGEDCVDTENYAMSYAQQNHMVYVSPYDDYEVIAGAATIGIELIRQLEHFDKIFVPVGGGGLIAGIASFIKTSLPDVEIIGCLPENSPVMAESVKAGHIVEMETKQTLSDATAGGIAPGSVTFPLCQRYVDRFILVNEKEIQIAINTMIDLQHQLIEGAAALTLASIYKIAEEIENQKVIAILSGANISLSTLKQVLI